MKIAFITTGYFPVPPSKGGAVEDLLYTLIRENENENKHCMEVYSVYDEKAKDISLQYNNTKFRYIKIPKIVQLFDILIYYFASNILRKEKNLSYRYMIQRLYFEYVVSRKINKELYDKIIIENTAASFLALKGKKFEKYQGRVIYHLHNEVGFDFGCEDLINNTQVVLGISEFVNKKFKERFPNYIGKYKILRNCVTRSFEENNENFNVRKKYQIEQNDFLILFAGRLSKEKGIYELIKAYKKNHKAEYKLMIVGGTYYGSNIESAFEKKIKKEVQDIKDQIIFTGYIDRNQINAFYKSADLIVLPSIWDEPAGLTIIEAMSSGTPVITTNVGGIPEYIGDNNCIVLDRDEDIIENIAENIQLVYENKNKYQRMAENAKKYAQKYNTKSYYREFCKIMEEIR